MAIEISRYNPAVNSGFTDHYTLSMELETEGRWVRYDDMRRELKIETEALKELLREASEALGLPLSKEIDDLRSRIEAELAE